MTPDARAPRALLPGSFSPARLTARQLLSVGGGIGCATWSYAGMYPQFDEGALRIVLALSSLIFGAIVSVKAIRSPTRAGAFARALGYAALLGIASSIVPLCFLGGNPFGMIFGVVFGLPTGLLYGVPLGLLAFVSWRGVHAESADGADRVAKSVGLWLVPMSLLALALTLAVDFQRHAYPATEVQVNLVLALPSIFAVMVMLGGVTLATRAILRMRARRQFVTRVAAGEEPMYRLRAETAGRVLEWVPDGHSPSAYRAMAQGVPLTVIED